MNLLNDPDCVWCEGEECLCPCNSPTINLRVVVELNCKEGNYASTSVCIRTARA